jgi:catechol 2,3-dioxygenase-like lactoylglutathione lyase family enzyme
MTQNGLHRPMPRVEAESLVLDMGHLILHVKDLEASLGFYHDLLGFEIKDEGHRACCGRVRIGTGGGELVLFQSEEFVPLGLGPQGLGTPLQLHVDNFPKAARFLESKGVRVHRVDQHGGTVFDPSGNAIGLNDRVLAGTTRRHLASSSAP